MTFTFGSNFNQSNRFKKLNHKWKTQSLNSQPKSNKNSFVSPSYPFRFLLITTLHGVELHLRSRFKNPSQKALFPVQLKDHQQSTQKVVFSMNIQTCGPKKNATSRMGMEYAKLILWYIRWLTPLFFVGFWNSKFTGILVMMEICWISPCFWTGKLGVL